ncbi:hypothetical protein [Bradyrhizobium sp.]|jgi:hypothetical protein|uniref:hypothetical protein n=1 Tax=Bradyrhizobium sp. TaxID=376 RepID=UPI003D129460
MTSGDLIPSDRDRPEQASLEVEFALVVARMIDSLKDNPEDTRQAIYELARYKLQEQLPDVTDKEKERTRQALETAIRGVEAFKEQNADIPAPARRPQLSGPRDASTAGDRFYPELIAPVGPSSHSNTLWSRLRRTAVMIAIIVAILVAVQQRERLLSLARIAPKPENTTIATIADRIAPLQAGNIPASAPLPAKPAPLRPTDYGVYAVSNGALIGLNPLPGRPPDIRVAVSAAITTASRSILPNGHPRFIVFRHDLASGIADSAEVRIVAKIAREFSAGVINKKPEEDAWVMRNISFPFRLSPVSDNPEMVELHGDDPALELTPGRYALVLKTQAYDFSVEGKPVDPKQCIERIVSTNGTFYSDCKAP